MTTKWLRWLYGVATAIALIPIWSVHYLPTQDGPSHLYNSWLLRELIRGSNAAIEHAYRIDWRPHPNWLTSAVLALLMTIVPPLIAEKLFVSGIVVVFAVGIWKFSGEEGRPYAFLALPFAYNLMFQSGFYNFCAGLGLYFLTVAVWWERRARTDVRTIALVATLLLVGYFTHPLPTLLAMGSIGLLGIATRASWKHLLAFVPVLPLFAWFAHTRGGGATAEKAPLGQILSYIAKSDVLFTFDAWQTWLGIAVSIILAILLIASRPRGARNAFALLILAMLAIYLFAPTSIVGGQLVRERMALFVALVPLAWIAPRWPQRVTNAIAVGLALLSITYSAYLTRRYRAMDRRMTELVDAAQWIGHDTVFLPLTVDRAPRGSFVGVLAHAIDYVAIEKRCVDLDNYETGTDYFPIANNPDIVAPDIYAIEAQTAFLDLAQFTSRAEYVFTRNIGSKAPVWTQLLRDYDVVHASPAGTVWRVTPERSGAPVECILLPVAGSTGPRGAPGGVWWNVTQSVRNDSSETAHIHATGCAEPPCEFELAPKQSVALSANGSFLVVYTEAKSAKRLTFTTIAERTAADGSKMSMPMPAVHERDFDRGTLTIANVPFDESSRPSLRAWTFGPHGPALIVRAIDASGRVLGEKPLGIDDHAYSVSPDLRSEFPNVRGHVNVVLDAGAQGRVWGFVSVNDPKTPLPMQLYPR